MVIFAINSATSVHALIMVIVATNPASSVQALIMCTVSNNDATKCLLKSPPQTVHDIPRETTHEHENDGLSKNT